MKRFSLLFALLFVVMIAIPALAQDDPYADVDPTGQVITYWYQHSSSREEAIQAIIQNFNATNEWGITVNGSYQGGYDEILEKVKLAIGTPDVPNITVAYQNHQLDYYALDGVLDLNPLVNSPTWGLTEAEIADFFPGFYNQDVYARFDGVRLGFPPNRSMEVLYYNADWLAELYAAGAITFEGAPLTPDQFREAACAAVDNPFSTATGDTGLSVGYELSIDASRFASWTFAFGGDVFDYENNVYTYTSDGAIAALTFLQELYADGCMRDVTESYGDQTDFGQGVTLFTVGSSSGLPYYRDAVEAGANFGWSVAAIPYTTEEPVMNVYGASVSVMRSTPEAELASWLFIKYYTSVEVQAEWAIASEYFPVRASVAEGLADYFAANPAYETAFSLLPYGHTEPPWPGYDAVRRAVNDYLTRIVLNGEDVNTALDELNTEANQILTDAMTAFE